MDSPNLTADKRRGKQQRQQILDFIRDYRKAHRISPSLAEITTALGLAANNEGNVSLKVNALIKEGWLYRAASGYRDLMLVHPRRVYWREENES